MASTHENVKIAQKMLGVLVKVLRIPHFEKSYRVLVVSSPGKLDILLAANPEARQEMTLKICRVKSNINLLCR